MAERDEHIDYELITKYLAGETLPDEQQEVEIWMNASEENRHSFARLKMLWEQTGRIVPNEKSDVDVDSGWMKFQKKVKDQRASELIEQPAAKSRSLLYYVSRVAAVLIIGIGVYFVFENIGGSSVGTAVLSAAQETVTDTLADGSVVSLNVHSQITYPENFSDKQRSVSLRGEAFFEVEADPARPFVIETKNVTVTVLGTSFYVNSYDSLAETRIGVKEGIVEVKIENSGQLVVLEKGESLSLNKSSNEVASGSYEPNEIFWKSKTLIFQNKEISEVFEVLEKYYGVKIEVENKQILNCRLTAKFSDEDIDTIFEIIGTNFNLSTSHENNLFFVSGNGCD